MMMRAAAAALLFAAAATWAAADSPPPPDSISAAKKDLAAIRTPPPNPDSAPALPSLDLRDAGGATLGDHPDLPALLAPEAELGPDGLKKKKEGTGNWLVDAMDKDQKAHPSGGRGKDRDDLLKTDADLLKADDHPGQHPEKELQPLDQSREKREEADKPAPAYNPLDSFMSGWISAKDHDLLLPAGRPDVPGAEGAKGKPDSLQSLELGPGGPGESLLPPLDATALADLKPAANPYVPELDVAAAPSFRSFAGPELPGFSSADLTDLPHGVTSTGVDPRPVDGPRTYLPDFAQPSDDDKYFKQMKRF